LIPKILEKKVTFSKKFFGFFYQEIIKMSPILGMLILKMFRGFQKFSIIEQENPPKIVPFLEN